MNNLLVTVAVKPVRKGAEQYGRWVEIRKGPHKRIVCSCGGSIDDAPHDFTQTIDVSACSHLTALYTGSITEDLREEKMLHGILRYYVRLTKLGAQMFRWRWAAQALNAR